MHSVNPVVRTLLVCEEARRRKRDSEKIDIFGLVSAVRGPSFPLHLTFCAYVVLTEGRGSGEGRIRILAADDESVIYPGTAHQLAFGSDPLALTAVIFRIPCCTFPKPGLYSVQFMYNGVCIADQPLRVEEQP